MSEEFSADDFGRLLTSFKRSGWRLETLTQYAEDEDVRHYLAGDREYIDPSTSQWVSTLRRIVASGRSYGRVHVVPRELTPYLEYEIFRGYQLTSAAGEQIGIVEGKVKETFAGLDWPEKDFWLFDNETVILMNYDKDGNLLGATKHTDQKTVDQCVAVRERAETLATPWADYVLKHAAGELT